jgi:hypothetical protein
MKIVFRPVGVSNYDLSSSQEGDEVVLRVDCKHNK